MKVFRVCHHKCLKFESFCPSLWCFRRNGTRFCCRRQFLDGVKRACRGSDCVSILLQIVSKKGSFCLIVLLRGPLIIVYKRSRWPKKLPPSTTSSRSSISKSNPSWKATSVSQLPTKLVLNSFWPAEQRQQQTNHSRNSSSNNNKNNKNEWRNRWCWWTCYWDCSI